MAKKLEIEKIGYYVDLVLRRHWVIILSFCLCMAAGIYLAFTLPKIYESSTLILVEPQKVSTDYVRSLVRTNISERIGSISQQILSRTNLEKIIREFSLFSGHEYKKLLMEEKVGNLFTRIQVQLSRRRGGYDTFSISVKDQEPETAMNVANTLASYFIEQNLKVRESHAIGTSVFLEGELISVRKRLEEVEETLKNYQKEYMGELPEQLGTNLAILGRLQEQLTSKQENFRETKKMLAALEQSISETQNVQPYSSIVIEDTLVEPVPEDSVNLAEFEEQLVSLKFKYTDNHPDVIQIKKTIADLEAQIEKDSENTAEEAGLESSQIESELPQIEFQDVQVIQLNEIKNDLKQQKADIAKILKQISIYEKRVENTPKREQELLSLNRDYKNIKDTYDSLVKRKLEAEIAVNMEKKQKSEQFRIIDPARLPEIPVSPDVKLLFLLAVAAGLGLGSGVILLMDFFDGSLKEPEQLESDLGLSVLGTIPQIYHAGDKVRSRLNNVLSVFAIAISLTLLAGFAVLALKGIDQTMEILQELAKVKSI
jgi:polysaccharide chain length determinant protein (PEP-CTERM system associated)